MSANGSGSGEAGGPARASPAMLLLQGARRFFRAANDLVLPPTCLCCDRLVASDQALCFDCWHKMPFLAPPWCQRLGLPFAYDLGPGAVSPQAIARPPVYDRLRAVSAYSGPARALVARLKYHDRPSVARAMGRWMARAGDELFALDAADAGPPLLVPVPLHPFRNWARRYNQAGLLAHEIARARVGVDICADGLRRVRSTRRQVGLDASARAKNVRGAFAVSGEGALKIAGRRCVLVDDVHTTGATANAAARVLVKAGAASVDVLVFAHAGADRPLG
ncbi:ComF family protein [Stappia sp. ES.058]|uniref:ComF family protein n=1 Tax=Stappia sp. ES.058 TaxID=1881061 RepID=UPI00087B22C3|nr:ComF family protein [Stappia sp. ES.058]SDU37737.1 comF family protein [Stappia sp. ES.058]